MASSAEPAPAPAELPAAKSSGRSLWLWVGGAFLFLALLWVAMFTAARSITIESVPDAPGAHRKP
ncbi:MAG: hypothetical protein KBC32_02255 [Candidatus Didemnitutus sp.]|nr:hypothetical protein [Candidatus Didemnitutus sp.]